MTGPMADDLETHLIAEATRKSDPEDEDEEYVSSEEEKDAPDGRMRTAMRQAAARGCVVVLPKDNELFVDIDDLKALRRFAAASVWLKKVAPSTTHTLSPSSSGAEGKFHAVVTMVRDIDPMERIALQAILGSDPRRELISWHRLRMGIQHPTLFFEKKEP